MSQGGCRPLAATLARALLKLAAAASLAFFYVYVGFAWLPSDFYTDFGFIYDNWGIPYPYGSELTAALRAALKACMRRWSRPRAAGATCCAAGKATRPATSGSA